MTQARLITFGFSHFCEKARWALDWHGIAYQEIGWPPGVHRILAKRCGAKGTTLPILLDGGMVIEGSGAIIDWAETKAQNCTRSLTPQANLSEAQEIERVPIRLSAFMCAAWRMRRCCQAILISSNRRSSLEHQVGIV